MADGRRRKAFEGSNVRRYSKRIDDGGSTKKSGQGHLLSKGQMAPRGSPVGTGEAAAPATLAGAAGVRAPPRRGRFPRERSAGGGISPHLPRRGGGPAFMPARAGHPSPFSS